MKIPAYALSDRELWTPVLVRNAIPEALRVIRAVPSSGYRHTILVDESELPPILDEDRPRPSRQDITRAEWVLVGYTDERGGEHPAWLNGAVLGYPDQRKALFKWSVWASYGKRDLEGEPETEEAFAKRIGSSYSTFRRHLDFAAGVVAHGLNEAGLKVWHVERPRRKNRHILTSA